MRSGVLALTVSVLLHGLVAAGIVAYMACAPGPAAPVGLDLASVELSFAERDDETAPAAPAPPAAERPEPPPEPRDEAPSPAFAPPAAERPEPPPAAPDAVPIPDPGPERAPMEAPPPVAPPAPAAAPVQAKVDAPPKPKRSIRPEYPKGARQRGEQGDVLVEIRVSAAGAVDEVKVVSSSGSSELDDAAVRAVRDARFTPARSGRGPVAAFARLTIEFKLKN